MSVYVYVCVASALAFVYYFFTEVYTHQTKHFDGWNLFVSSLAEMVAFDCAASNNDQWRLLSCVLGIGHLMQFMKNQFKIWQKSRVPD